MKISKRFNIRFRKNAVQTTKQNKNGNKSISDADSIKDLKLKGFLINRPATTFRMHLVEKPKNFYSNFHSGNQISSYHQPLQQRLHHLHGTEEYFDKPPKRFPRATKDNFLYVGSFHEAIGKVLLMAEFFAIMPVKGVTMPHPRYLSFSWSNVRTWYSIIFIAIMTFDSSLTMHKVLNGPITFNNIEPMIFRLSTITLVVSALALARKWPDLMVYWYEIEQKLPQYDTQFEKRRMAHKIRMVTFVGMMLSLTEHLLNLISIIHYSNFCPITNDPIENFFLLANEQIFRVFPYSYWLGWCGKLINFISTFAWNYMDVFVMIISIGLSSKFQQLNDNLMKYKNEPMPTEFWSQRRIQYRNLCSLCERIDNSIALITMVSFSNNLYFICVQLLKSLNKMPSIAHAAYFYFSLFFLLGRTLAVSLYSSGIHDESRMPLRILRCVPKESWCLEAKRFAEEISNDLVALSGMKFFHLTRKLVLSVAGTIVTYELVLIQFHEDTNLWDCENDRNNHMESINGSRN